jgi:hypothetical protein
MSSPVNFNPLGALKNVAKGFINRKDYGGGLGGVVKATGAQITGEHEDNKLDAISSKLDTLIGESETGDAGATANVDPVSNQVEDTSSIATPLNFKEFMTTPQQAPSSNGTGSANAVFGDVRPMSVSDPNIDTKGSLFNKQESKF